MALKINSIRSIAIPVIALAAFPALGQVDFSMTTITESLTVAEIQTALGVTGTSAIDGVALAPADNIFIMHRDNSANETFARLNPVTNAVSFQKSIAQVATDLGAPYTNNITPVGEFVFDPSAGTSGTLYFADNSTAAPTEYSLLKINVATGIASEVLRSSNIEGWNSHGVLPSGKIAGVLGEDFSSGEPSIGHVDPAAGSPSFTTIYTEDDFLGVTPGAVELPIEAVGIDPLNGDAYVFAHDELELFRITNFDSPTTITHLTIPGWNGVVDLHGLAVDEDHNVYGFDEASEAIRIWNGTNTYAVTFADIEAGLGGSDPFSPALWRGMKARKINATQSEVWLSSATADYGVVRIVFGAAPSSVSNWALY
jgi:hypothetical protein